MHEATIAEFHAKETDSLILYLSKDRLGLSEIEKLIRPALTVFEREYPDITVICREYDEEEYETIIRTEIPAGQGPDLLIADPDTLPDVNKTLTTALFEDLNPYMESDGAFDPDDFIGNILKCGQYDGKQFLIPLKQEIKVLVTTQEILDEEGIDGSALSSRAGFLEALTAYRGRHPDLNFTVDTGAVDPNVGNLRLLYESGGTPMIDYGKNEVLLGADDIRPMLEVCRLYFIKAAYKTKTVDNLYKMCGCLTERACLFTEQDSPDLFLTAAIHIRNSGETPLLVPIPSADDRFVSQVRSYAAIPVGANNKLNAWRFLKILLSKKIQTDRTALLGSLPVMESAVEPYMIQVTEGKGIAKNSKEFEEAIDLVVRIDRAEILSPTVWGYFSKQFTPFIQGKKTFDVCFEGLMNTLEIYKDE